MKINIKKARETFSEIINRVAIKKERVILMSRNKPKAAIVSLKDVELLEDRSFKKARRLTQLKRFKKIRDRLSKKGVVSDSVLTLKQIRESRVERISSSG